MPRTRNALNRIAHEPGAEHAERDTRHSDPIVGGATTHRMFGADGAGLSLFSFLFRHGLAH